MSGVRSALIVATSHYDDPRLSRLRSPAQDAEALAAVLGDREVGGFDVDVALDQPHAVVTRSLSRFLRDRRPDDTLLVHLSCHGIKDEHGELYFAASDTERDDLDATAVAAEWLRRLMDRCRSRRIILMLDCCYSGAFGRGMLARGDASVHTREQLDGRGRAIITASDSLEYALESDTDESDRQPSIFTTAVVSGLTSGAADRDGDGVITVPELFRHIEDAVRDATPYMTPHLWMLGVEGELVIARTRPTARADMSAADLGRLARSPNALARKAAVDVLVARLASARPDEAEAARRLLERLAADDSRSVSASAATALHHAGARPKANWDLKRPRPATSCAHDARVRDLCFDPRGQRLATASDDGCARVWSADGDELLQLAHDGEVHAVAFSPDGALLATGAEDGCARVWAAADGSLVAATHHDGTVRAVAFSSDGTLMASAGDDRRARLSRPAGDRPPVVLEHDGAVWSVAFSPTASLVVTGSSDTTSRLWTLAGEPLARLEHGGALWGLAISADGRLLATASGNKQAQIWEIADPRHPIALRHDSAVRSTAFSPDGRLVVTSGDDGTARLWDATSGHEHARLAHDDAVPRACFAHHGQLVATASYDNTAAIWDTTTGSMVTRLPHAAPVRRVAFALDDRLLATAAGNTAQLWHAAD